MKILCIGKNYLDHAKEMNSQVPKNPMVFMKPSTALNPDNKLTYPDFTSNLHYELEIVIGISKIAKNVDVEEASNYYDKIGLGIDFTARDIQAKCKEKGHPWERAKAFDNSASLSEWRPKESYNLKNLNFSLLLNDKEVQKGNSNKMIFNINTIISYTSQFFTLEPEDLIFTGTPAGVGPVKAGDQLQGYLEGELLLNVSII